MNKRKDSSSSVNTSNYVVNEDELENEKIRKLKRTKRFQENHPLIKPPFNIKTLSDLIAIGNYYNGDAFDVYKLWKMIPSLEKLNSMIGMQTLKDHIINMVIHFLLEFHINPIEENENQANMMHTVISGPPGCGKSTIAKIIGEIYHSLGILSTNKFNSIKRSDLIGKYLGQSEAKTMSVLTDSLGGILFIDEAYSMGQSKDIDSYSKASVDLINQFLSEHPKDFICIIAGYKKELEENFFSINKGLERRFPWKFEIDEYKALDLLNIFKLKVRNSEWALEEDAINEKFFERNRNIFKFTGGDIVTFLTKCKIAHARRIFGFKKGKRILTKEDIEKGLEIYKQCDKTNEDEKWKYLSLYI